MLLCRSMLATSIIVSIVGVCGTLCLCITGAGTQWWCSVWKEFVALWYAKLWIRSKPGVFDLLGDPSEFSYLLLSHVRASCFRTADTNSVGRIIQLCWSEFENKRKLKPAQLAVVRAFEQAQPTACLQKWTQRIADSSGATDLVWTELTDAILLRPELSQRQPDGTMSQPQSWRAYAADCLRN